MRAGPLLVWSDALLAYDLGPAHPMSPARLRLTADLIERLGLLDRVRVEPPEPATDAELELVHEPGYLAAVRAAVPDARYGLGSEDDPVFPGMHEAGALIAGGTLAAARAVWTGAARRAVHYAGGMHHAMPGRMSGFCIYNDAAVAIAWLLANGARRVAYLDLDAHHGDGVERAFWDDPRVLTISVHESGTTLFPGTGFAQDVGGAAARGGAVNIPLPAHTGDAGWLRALEAVAQPLLEEFEPDLLLTQHGCDSHHRDPLAALEVSVDAQRVAAEWARAWADAHAHGRWVAVGGGGYDIASTVPRVWANLVALAADADLPPDLPLPPAWLAEVDAVCDDGPSTMSDGVPPAPRLFSAGYDPADPVDRAILATRRAVFPEHGLDPQYR